MEVQPNPDPTVRHVTSRSVAANLRILSVRFDEIEIEQGPMRDLLGRIDQIVALFLEKHWGFPRRFVAIVPLSYLLSPAPDDRDFPADVEKLTALLERHLFGEQVEIRCLIGEDVEIERLASETEEAFLAAEATAAQAEEAAAAEPAVAPPPLRRVRAAGDPELRWIKQLRLFAGYDAPKKAVLCYIATLARGVDPSAPVLYDDFGRTAGAKVEDFELAALSFAASRVAGRLEAGAVGYCLVPLSYETLAERRRRELFLTESSRLPDEVRRFILPSVFGGPGGPSSSYLMEIVGAIRGCYPYVDWQTRTCAIELEPMKHANVFAVTLALPSNPHDRAIELARLPGFVRRLTALRIRPGVTGVATTAEIATAIAARAHYLSGPAVSAEMPELAPYLKLPPDRLPLSS
jgi:hypothetical protein